MSEVLAGAPDEVVTNAILRMVSLSPFGHNGELALITLDNGADHTRPNTFGPASLNALSRSCCVLHSNKLAMGFRFISGL